MNLHVNITGLIVGFSIFLTVFTPVFGQNDSSHLVRWNLNQGDLLDVELTQTTGITTNIDTRSQKIGNEMLLTMAWKVTSASDDTCVIEQSISRIKLTIDAPGKTGTQTTTIDTDSDVSPKKLGAELLKQVAPLIGTKYTVTMNSNGGIVDVLIPKESMEAIRKAPSSMQIREVITKDGLKELLGQSAITFPENKITAGDEWSSTTAAADSSELSKTNRFVYVGLREKDGEPFHEFDVNTEITVGESPNVQIEKFTGHGKIWFSTESSTILISQFSNSMTTGRDYRDKTLVSTVTTDVNMKVVRKK